MPRAHTCVLWPLLSICKHLLPLIAGHPFCTSSPQHSYGRESWTTKKAEDRRIDAFELWCWRRLLRVPWTARRSNQIKLKEISPEYSLEGLMLKLKAPQLYPPDSKSQLIGKDPDAGKHRRQEEKGMTEDEMVEWHYWLNTHEFEQTPRDSVGQGSLVCYSSWGHKELDTIYLLNNNSNTTYCKGAKIKAQGNLPDCRAFPKTKPKLCSGQGIIFTVLLLL